MTILDNATKNQITSTGATDTYTYTFETFDETDIDVYLDGVLKTLTTDYTVTGVGNENGGTVVFGTDPANDVIITFIRTIDSARSTDFTPSGDIAALTVNTEFDRVIAKQQELEDQKVLRAEVFDDDSSVSLFIPQKATRANKLFGWDANGSPTAEVATATSTAIALVTLPQDQFDGDGANKVFAMSQSPGSANGILVWIGATSQIATTDYSVSGSTLTFVVAPTSGTDNVTVRFLSTIGTVSLAALADGSVTEPSLTFASDTNTGIYLASPDVLNITTGGTDSIKIGAGLQVGVPTGGDKGVGTVNIATANGLYFNDTQFGLGIGNIWTASQTISLTTDATALSLISSDAGAGTGPTIILRRNSASPDVNDNIGAIKFIGEDSADNQETYASLETRILDETSTEEDGALLLSTVVEGALAIRVRFGAGVQVGSPTGGDKGAGTLNATDIFVDNNTVLVAGKHTVWVPATSMIPTTTNGAARGLTELATNDVMLDTLNYDQTTNEFAQTFITLPKSWDEGPITARFRWTTTGNTGTVRWGIQAISYGDNDALDTALGTAIDTDDSILATNDFHISDESADVTVGGTPVEGDTIMVQVLRDAAAAEDTLNADAKLIGFELFVTLNAGNDA